MNVEHLGNGAETVCGVHVATVGLVVGQSPVQLVIGIALPVGFPEGRQVVAVGALYIQHLAEHSVLGHVKAVELEEVVAAGLEHHTVQAGLLREVDELPNLAEVHSRGHLDSRCRHPSS